MLTAADLLHLDYTPDLTEAGIAFVCRSVALARTGHLEPSFRHLRRSIAGVAAELAFRRYLQGQSIPYKTIHAAPFVDPDRYDLSLDGRRCELISYFISHEKQVSALQRDPERLLQSPALLASDEFAAEHHRADDLYLFAFVLGLESYSRPAEHSTYWVHLLPKTWVRPLHPLSPHALNLMSDASEPVQVELGGLDREHEFITARLELPPRQAALVETPFASVAYAHPLERPQGCLRLCRDGQRDPYVISPGGWVNLWFQGLEILLAGWLTHEEFRRRAGFVNIGARTLQFDQTRVKNLGVPLGRLEPVSALLEKARARQA